MDENAKRIFDASGALLQKLQTLAAFFGAEVIFKIFLRSQLIHKLFENSPELDIHRLELYHLQFTESIVALLEKIRAANEKAVVLLLDEIQFNEALIRKFREELQAEESYDAARTVHTVAINDAIFGLYENLSDHSRDNPFPPSIGSFSAAYAALRFHEITEEQLESFTRFSLEKEYKNSYGIIDKKLLGLQCRHGFDNEFVCGLRAGGETLEVYKMTAHDTYFIFYPRRHFFNDFDMEQLRDIEWKNPPSAKAKLVRELTQKNVQMRGSEAGVRTALSEEIAMLLQTYLDRITALNFLDATDYEVQANILKAMLDTEGL